MSGENKRFNDSAKVILSRKEIKGSGQKRYFQCPEKKKMFNDRAKVILSRKEIKGSGQKRYFQCPGKTKGLMTE